ncbi:MAG: cytochrome c biogenesis protein CcsA [Deltaproteobacteria bacterium]|nr:cytochrome c biogenesis protein CcsA [Deltaproteobacteria bacterium]
MRKGLFLVSALGAITGFVALPFLVFVKAPIAFELFFNQKIFYYHVPAAWVMFLSVFVSGIASIAFLATRRSKWDDVAWAAGDVVVVMGAIVLTTGPIWAKAAWGVFWVWDARLTSSLLLWMIFVAYTLVRRYGGPGSERLAAGLSLFGMVDVPLVFFAVNFWKTQHPNTKVVPGLPPEMRQALLVGMVAYTLFYLVLLSARLAVGRGERRLASVTDLAVETGVLE